LSRVNVCGASKKGRIFGFWIKSVVDLFVDNLIVYFSEFRKTDRTFGVGSEIVGTDVKG